MRGAGVDGEGFLADVELGGGGLERDGEGELWWGGGGRPGVEECVEPVDPGGWFGVGEGQDETAAGLDEGVVRVAVFVWEPQLCLDLGHLRLGALADESPFQSGVDPGAFRCDCEASIVHETGLGEQSAVKLDGSAGLDGMNVDGLDAY